MSLSTQVNLARADAPTKIQGAVHLGIDVGSTTVKIVVLDAERRLLAHRYVRANGQPRQTLLDTLAEVLGPEADARSVGFTGSGGGPIGQAVGAGHVNELIAQTRAVGAFYPHARTVIEIGGQDSKLLILEPDPESGRPLLVDFAMNTLCAAGTGSFLDQQADRLGVAIEDEFARLALQSQEPARIAGRCTVFAKSDMIHLQQKGVPLPDVLAGLCHALVRNFRSVIGRGKDFAPPIIFQGGVAYNQAVIRAFESVLGLEPGALVIPRHPTLMAALGAAYEALDAHARGDARPFGGFEPLAEMVRAARAAPPNALPALLPHAAPEGSAGRARSLSTNGNALPVYLGIDVGSISTNVVLIDEACRVVARRYLRTEGRPLEAARRGLDAIGREVGERVVVRGVGATGSGRQLTGYFVGADVVRNEITAQATAAVHLDPAVDTVIEIGGQDSKYIRLERGAVVDFTMNKACAAGTGSFLEEQAERLKLDIETDFGALALDAAHPACMGERCTVFMESDLIHHQQQGAAVADLTAGLAYAIAHNYLNKVVNGHPIGERVLFQGGVAANAGVVAAFQQILGRPVIVPPHHDVTGAIGAAILAQEEMARRAASNGNAPPPTRFQGFDLRERQVTTKTFTCSACPNLCEVHRVTVAGAAPMFYGARCERFEEVGQRASRAAGIPDLFAERLALLTEGYDAEAARRAAITLGMPRALTFYDLFPYWRAFFAELDVGLVLSDVTNPSITAKTAAEATSEACFPVKVMTGHVLNLLDQGVTRLFVPGVVNRENVAPGQTHNAYCPFIAASPWLATAGLDLTARGAEAIRFPLHLLWEETLVRELRPLKQALGARNRDLKRAINAGRAAQQRFYRRMQARGREALAALGPERQAVVLVGRPYNTSDPGLSQDLPFKIRQLGVLPLPMDCLSLASVDISDRFDNMFWRSGQDILAAGRLIREHPHLHALYITNFGCGPDSFLLSFFRRVLGEKPFLELELDDHTADAGVITRCEAFFDSLGLRPTGGAR